MNFGKVLVLLFYSYYFVGIHRQPGVSGQLDRLLAALQTQINNLGASLNRSNTVISTVNLTAAYAQALALSAVNLSTTAITAAAAAQSDIENELRPDLANVTATAGRLVRINQIWKKNFQVVNSTFQLLRRKISFRAPHIPLS